MSNFTIRKAFEKSLASMPGSVETAYENVHYEPQDGVPYQAVQLVPMSPENPCLNTDYYRERGFFRLLLFFPARVGAGTAATYAQTVRDWFYRGRTIQEDGLDIIIQSTPEINGGREIDNRYVIGVDVQYFASVYL